MSEHLPECQRWFTDMPAPDECPACEMFRACEQRVRTAMHTAEREEYLNGLYEGKNEGFAAGLSAARDAVAAVDRWDHNNYALIFDPHGWAIDRDEALAAIDQIITKNSGENNE